MTEDLTSEEQEMVEKYMGCKPLEQIKGNLYKINKHQYLKINKRGNGEIIAPIKDPVTKKFSCHNLVLTGGTVWGLIKVMFIIFLLLFLLWRYNVEVADCLEIRKNFNPETGCIGRDYFQNIKEVDNEKIRIGLPSLAEGNDKKIS